MRRLALFSKLHFFGDIPTHKKRGLDQQNNHWEFRSSLWGGHFALKRTRAPRLPRPQEKVHANKKCIFSVGDGGLFWKQPQLQETKMPMTFHPFLVPCLVVVRYLGRWTCLMLSLWNNAAVAEMRCSKFEAKNDVHYLDGGFRHVFWTLDWFILFRHKARYILRKDENHGEQGYIFCS